MLTAKFSRLRLNVRNSGLALQLFVDSELREALSPTGFVSKVKVPLPPGRHVIRAELSDYGGTQATADATLEVPAASWVQVLCTPLAGERISHRTLQLQLRQVQAS